MHMGARFSDTTRRKSSGVTDYKHKTSLYGGMMKSPAKSSGGSFVTFRAISRNSDPGSWWHPGFEPLNLIERVKEHINNTFPDILNKIRMRNF
jgi:hypothetical protein